MIYAVSDTRGKWVILRGWHGCLTGQGSVLEKGVDDKELNNKMNMYRELESKGRLIEAERQVSGLPESEYEDQEYEYFENWYKSQEKRFRTGQFSCEEEALSAFLEGVEYGKKRVLWGADDMEGISE